MRPPVLTLTDARPEDPTFFRGPAEVAAFARERGLGPEAETVALHLSADGEFLCAAGLGDGCSFEAFLTDPFPLLAPMLDCRPAAAVLLACRPGRSVKPGIVERAALPALRNLHSPLGVVLLDLILIDRERWHSLAGAWPVPVGRLRPVREVP
jgi:hypothetical protein